MSQFETTITSFLDSVDTAAPARLPPSASVARAAEAMRENGRSCVLVVEGDRLVGVFTERDFLYRVAAPERSLEGTTLAEVMTAAPETLGPADDIRFAMNKMAVGGFRHVPIVDGDGKAVGVIRVRDVVDHLAHVFAAVDLEGGEHIDEWIDLGGG